MQTAWMRFIDKADDGTVEGINETYSLQIQRCGNWQLGSRTTDRV